MSKKNVITLALSTVGGILFALGMCMCLVPEWNAMQPGMMLGGIGLAVLLGMVLVRRKMEGKKLINLNRKVALIVAVSVAGALALGAGLSMVLLWEIWIPGIAVGILGIAVLMLLIPLIKSMD